MGHISVIRPDGTSTTYGDDYSAVRFPFKQPPAAHVPMPDLQKAADEVVAVMAAGQIRRWELYPLQFWKACPALDGVTSPGPAHVKALRQRVADIVADPNSIAADLRDAQALRLWADRIEAEAADGTQSLEHLEA